MSPDFEDTIVHGTPEIQRARVKNRWLLITVVVLATLALAASVVGVSVTLSSKGDTAASKKLSAQNVRISKQQVAAAARLDCAREVSASQTTVKETEDRLFKQWILAAVTQDPNASVVQRQWAEALTARANLRPANEEVDRLCAEVQP